MARNSGKPINRRTVAQRAFAAARIVIASEKCVSLANRLGTLSQKYNQSVEFVEGLEIIEGILSRYER